MTANRLSFLLLCLGCLYVFPSQAAFQSECKTIESIEDVNKGGVKRIAHIKSKNAILFVALDPIWSEPEFQYEGARDQHFISSVKRLRESLVKVGINEIVIWELTGVPGLAVAVTFKEGCQAGRYGEPDQRDKLIKMHEAFLLISKYGVDNPSVRDGIKRILLESHYAVNDDMVDVVLDNLRLLMTKEKPSHSNK